MSVAVLSGLSSTATAGSSTAKYDDNAKVTIAGTALSQDLDPFKAGGTLIGIVDIYDGLIKPTPQMKLTPGLATAWKYSPDNLKLTLTLRQGVKFSDGTPFDSSAVVASLNRARSASTSQQRTALASISAVSAVDPNTVDVTLSRIDAALVNNLSGPAGFVVNPKMINDDTAIRSGKTGVGTGPYTVKSFAGVSKIVLERNDSYWDKAATQHAPKEYEFNVITDGGARLNGLKTGAYDAIQSTGTPGLNGPGGLPDIDKNYVDTKVAGFSAHSLAFRLDKPPFDNVKVRLAVAHALDLVPAVKGVLGDEMNCAPTVEPQIFRPGVPGNDPTLKAQKFDLKLAKQLLAEAGYPDGKGFPAVTVASTLTSNDAYASQTFQGMLARIGITNVTIDIQASRIFVLADFQAGKANAMTTNAFSGGGIDPSSGIDSGVLQAPMIDKSTEGQQLATLIAQGKTELDPTKRAEIYKQFSKIVNQTAMFIPYCRLTNGYAHVKKLTGFENSYQILNGIAEARYLRVSTAK